MIVQVLRREIQHVQPELSNAQADQLAEVLVAYWVETHDMKELVTQARKYFYALNERTQYEVKR